MSKDSISNEALAGIINAGFAGIEERMATKDDVAGVGAELKGDIAGLDRRLGSLERSVGSLQERTTSVERRLGSVEGTLADVKDSVESLERSTSDTYDLLSGRVGRIERHLGLPHVEAAPQLPELLPRPFHPEWPPSIPLTQLGYDPTREPSGNRC